MKKLLVMLCTLLLTAGAAGAETIDFGDLTLDPESVWNGSDGEGGFQSGFAEFSNYYQLEPWETWSGFAYSNRTDTEVVGYGEDGGEYNAITGEGYGGSEIYAVAYWSEDSPGGNPAVEMIDDERELSGAFFTNTNLAYYSMLEGDDFADPFDSDDWLQVKVTGFDAAGEETGDLVFYLAQDGEIVDYWKWVDFEVLGSVKKLEFEMASSDTGDWGMNTPSYFCMDGLASASPADEDPVDEDPVDEDPVDDDDDSSSDTCFIKTVGSGLF